MTEDTVPGARGYWSVSVGDLRIGGALWVMAGVTCAGLLIFVFVGEGLLLQNPGLSALFLGGAVTALLTGVLLIARPGPGVVRWSTIVGVAWLIVFGSLLFTGLVTGLDDADLGPLLSTSLITVFGLAGALAAFWAGRRGAPTRVSQRAVCRPVKRTHSFHPGRWRRCRACANGEGSRSLTPDPAPSRSSRFPTSSWRPGASRS